MHKCCVILLAAGKSKRFKYKNIKKQFFKINNKTLIEYSLDLFTKLNFVKQIILAVDKNDIKITKRLVNGYINPKRYEIFITYGGKERYNSVSNCIKYIKNNIDYVLIHDVARPLVNKNIIIRCIKEIKNYDCVIPAIKPVDTVKLINNKSEVIQTLNRNNLVLVQTPQVFKKNVVKHIYSEKILKKWSKKCLITDDAQLAELEGYKVKVVEGEKYNIKLTTKDDISLLKYHLCKK